MAVDAVEGERENPRADEDEHDKAGKPRCAVQRFAQYPVRQAALEPGHQQRACGPHRPTFGRRRNTQKDCPQDQKDQRQRRDQNNDHLLGQVRELAKLQALVSKGYDIGQRCGNGRAPDAGTAGDMPLQNTRSLNSQMIALTGQHGKQRRKSAAKSAGLNGEEPAHVRGERLLRQKYKGRIPLLP